MVQGEVLTSNVEVSVVVLVVVVWGVTEGLGVYVDSHGKMISVFEVVEVTR